MKDVLHYQLNAYANKDQVNNLQDEITNSLNSKADFPLRRLLQLLPLNITNPGQILKRGNIKWVSDGNVENNYTDPQTISLGDPALGTFFLALPSIIKSTYSIQIDLKQLTFVLTGDPIVMQLNKLVEQGYKRSAFQIISQLQFNNQKFTTILQDKSDSNKWTYLDVLLSPKAINTFDSLSKMNSEIQKISTQLKQQLSTVSSTDEVESISLFSSSSLDVNCCGINPFNPGQQFYVFAQDLGPHGSGKAPCITSDNSNVTFTAGGIKWVRISDGFSTQSDADAFKRTCSQCI